MRKDTPASPYAALEAQGWTRQFIASEPRLSEAIEAYRDAGFEVHLEPLPADPEHATCGGTPTDGECRACFQGFEQQYKIIFTRKTEGGKEADHDDDLF